MTASTASNEVTSSTLLFPYARWLREEGFRSPYCLTASGLPAPDPALLGAAADLLDLGPASLEALPAVEARLSELFGVRREQVLVTAGASGAMLVVALALFPGACVATELPGFEPLRVLARLHARETALLRREPANGFALPRNELERALAGPGPVHVLLCQPHNPTGALLSADELADVAARAGKTGGLLISNEVYMEFAPPSGASMPSTWPPTRSPSAA